MNSSPSLDAKLQVSIIEPSSSTSEGGANMNPIASKSTIGNGNGNLKQSLAQRRGSTEIGAGLILGLAAANASSDDRGNKPESATESHTFRIWEERGVVKTAEDAERAGRSAGSGQKVKDWDGNSHHSPSHGSSPGTKPHATDPSLSSINLFRSHVPSDSERRDSSHFLLPLLHSSSGGVGQNHHSIHNLLSGNEPPSNTTSTTSAAPSSNSKRVPSSSDYSASSATSSPNAGRQTNNRFREGTGEPISLHPGNPNPYLDSNADSKSNTSGNGYSSNSANRRNECTFRNCNKDFARLHDLKRHLASAHGVNARIVRGVICTPVANSKSTPTEEAGHESISPETLRGSSDPDADGFNSIPPNSNSNSAFPFPQVFESKSKPISHPHSFSDPQRNASASSPSSSTPNQILTPTSPKKDSRHHCSFPECKSSFVHDKDLARHFKSHTEGKSHVCLECKKAFSRKDALRRHVKSGMEKGNKCAGSPLLYRSQDEFGAIERAKMIYDEVMRDSDGDGNEDGIGDGNAGTKAKASTITSTTAKVNADANWNVNGDIKGKGREERARQLDAESGPDGNYQEVVINLKEDFRNDVGAEMDHRPIRNKQRDDPQEDKNRHEKRKDQERGNEIASNLNDRSLLVCAHNQVPSSASSSPTAYSFPMPKLLQDQQKQEKMKGSDSHLRDKSSLPSLNNSGKVIDSYLSNSPMDFMCSRETDSPHHGVGFHPDPYSHSHPSTSISNSRTNPKIHSESPESQAVVFYCPYPGCSSFFKLPEQLGIHAQSHVSKSRLEAEMKIRGNQKDGTYPNSNLASSYPKSRPKSQSPVKIPFNQEEVRQGQMREGSSSRYFSPFPSPSSTKISSARTQEHSFFLPPLKRFKTFSSIPSSSSSIGSNSYNELQREPTVNHFRNLTSPSESHLHPLSNPHLKHQSNQSRSEIRRLSSPSSIDSPNGLNDSQQDRFSPSKSPFERNQREDEFNGKDSETEIQKRRGEDEVNQDLFVSSIERQDAQAERNRDDQADGLELDISKL